MAGPGLNKLAIKHSSGTISSENLNVHWILDDIRELLILVYLIKAYNKISLFLRMHTLIFKDKFHDECNLFSNI